MVQPPRVSVSCTSLSETILQKARDLAKNSGLPYVGYDACTSPYILHYTDERLQLEVHPKRQKSGRTKPLWVDFAAGAAAYRHDRNRTIKQPLARAVGIKPGFRPDILDATAGLGYDAFVLAGLGCRVHLCERSPVIGALLQDGLERAAAEPALHAVVRNLSLQIADAGDVLEHLIAPVHTVYLDPMYPHSAKSALNKREMRIIRDIVGGDDDAAAILKTALVHATRRVVVKRPKGAEFLGGMEPSHQHLMKNSRFDVYLIGYL